MSHADAYQKVQEMEKRHQADWSARVYGHEEAASLAARHCDETRALAYKLAREVIALSTSAPQPATPRSLSDKRIEEIAGEAYLAWVHSSDKNPRWALERAIRAALLEAK